MVKFVSVVVLICAIGMTQSFAQIDSSKIATKEQVGELKESLDGTNETVAALKTTLDALKKIKVSGYIQTQFQVADSAGISSYEGGDFPPNVRSRFSVRRGRVKVNYDNDLSQYVFEIDASSSGVSLKDAYIWIKEPWLRTFALKTGAFYRPFGYEILRSHSVYETPEFARATQTLFPAERDLGVQLEGAPETGTLSNFNFKAGLFNGVGITANENDRVKDFIGRVGYELPFEEQNLSIDGGFSMYSGEVTSASNQVYYFDDSSPTKSYKVDSTRSNIGGNYGRGYFGVDLQVNYDVLAIGGTALRGEFITGQQPGTSASSAFYTPSSKADPLYLRQFTGWYILFLQNFGLKNQFVAKYDVYDPNKDVEGSDIGAVGSNLTPGDVKYSTLGFGWVYYWDPNVKFTLYYDMVTNEKANAAATGSLASYRDDIKDNVFTVRMQFKF